MFLVVAAASGFLAVALGAFGAHGLRARFAELDDVAKRLEWWTTAAQYHLAHSVALALIGLLILSRDSTAARVSGYCMMVGIVVFSGSLYVMTLTGVRALGAVTPIGGLALLGGWAALVVAAAALR
jgi:uncharacterized membrane protein YgdD (TMEM256/DUF423 family)